MQQIRNLLLRIAAVDAQISDPFKFENFITHSITREKDSLSENEILHFILFSDILFTVGGENMIDYEAMYFQLFNAMTDVLTQLEQQNYGQAKQLLILAQQRAEQVYLDAEE